MEAASGGILRDNNGSWVAGYCRKISHCPVFHAELWAVFDDLNIAWSHGLRRIIVELDNSEVVRRLNLPGQPNYDAITRQICSLLEQRWCIKVIYIKREANELDDALAKIGRNDPPGLLCFQQPPSEIQTLLRRIKCIRTLA
ncbi:hypothetical protein F3Y22_tig00006570pilonHSYRG00027 [Hibiscus syriacus]|uniref:RNase H type-1 domain-containing protein n=1 Tax=Hibiscus syriacus TaxID=106335 RepID=A0A6A3CGS3_HIBSY|nr:hypothetical protein F3Y22_tig00006570pilonHSYRG00027 [Hibiscus syriacus]